MHHRRGSTLVRKPWDSRELQHLRRYLRSDRHGILGLEPTGLWTLVALRTSFVETWLWWHTNLLCIEDSLTVGGLSAKRKLSRNGLRGDRSH
jgi:hypothetical protein